YSQGGYNGRKETQTKRSIHETGSARFHAGNRSRNKGNPPHRADQKALGIHQEERSSGQEEQKNDQCRRQSEGGIRWQETGFDVRHDQARQQTRQVTKPKPFRHTLALSSRGSEGPSHGPI